MQITSILDVWQRSELASEVASKDVSFLNQYELLLGKTKKKEPSKLENSWTKMLVNKTYSYFFKTCVAQSNIS